MQVQVGNNIPHSSAMLQNNIFHPHPAYLRSHSTANPEAYSSLVEMPHLNLLRTIVGGEGKWGSKRNVEKLLVQGFIMDHQTVPIQTEGTPIAMETPIDACLKGCRFWEPGAFKLAWMYHIIKVRSACIMSGDPASIPGLVPQQQQQSGGVLDNVPQSRVNPDLLPGWCSL